MNKEETVIEIVKNYPTYYDVVKRLLFIQQENKELKEKYENLEKLYDRMYNINCKARKYAENNGYEISNGIIIDILKGEDNE